MKDLYKAVVEEFGFRFLPRRRPDLLLSPETLVRRIGDCLFQMEYNDGTSRITDPFIRSYLNGHGLTEPDETKDTKEGSTPVTRYKSALLWVKTRGLQIPGAKQEVILIEHNGQGNRGFVSELLVEKGSRMYPIPHKFTLEEYIRLPHIAPHFPKITKNSRIGGETITPRG